MVVYYLQWSTKQKIYCSHVPHAANRFLAHMLPTSQNKMSATRRIPYKSVVLGDFLSSNWSSRGEPDITARADKKFDMSGEVWGGHMFVILVFHL